MRKLTDKMNDLVVKGYVKGMQAKGKLAEGFTQKSGEGFVDTALKILISVIVGALLLAGLAYFKQSGGYWKVKNGHVLN